MASNQAVWHREPDGVLAAEADGFRLVVQTAEKVDGLVRFLVLRRETKDGQYNILGSGTKEDVGAAMKAAEQMAQRLVLPPFGSNF